MHLQKFDKHYTRRHFLESAGRSAVGASMLAPLWDVIARDGDVTAAYPDEALSIEHYSNGAVKPGGTLDASNVDSVKELLDPVAYFEVAQQGRIIDIKAPETDIMRLNPPPYTRATLRNRGKARVDDTGNVVIGDGKPWIGGHPFPDNPTARQIMAGMALHWTRHDAAFYTGKEWDLDPEDNVLFEYDQLFIEFMATGRTAMEPRPYFPGHEDKLRFSTFLMTSPQAFKGTSVLNIWHYDQRKLPDFYGFLPDFKRVRRFTTNQRFEPSIPGSNYYPTDTYGMGDPISFWGNFKLVGKVPFIGGAADTWAAHKDNWVKDRVGGKTGTRFFRNTMELIPEAYVVDMEPVGFPSSPYGKRRLWFDARTLDPFTIVVYDRKGNILKNYEDTGAVYELPDGTRWPEKGDLYWSWISLCIHNIQNDTVSLVQHVAEIDGGFKVRVNDPDIYENFCTIPAVRRLGK